jgi:lysozyme
MSAKGKALDVLLALVKRFEGLRLHAYLCPAGVQSIGYGSTGPDIKLGMSWTAEQAEQRMQSDAQVYLHGTAALCPPARDERLGALADFSYNLGLTRLKASTLRKRVLACDWPGAAAELQKWTRGGGRVLPGLVARRAAEASYFTR